MKLQIRKASMDDAVFFYKLRNDLTTRKNCFNQKKIKYLDHLKWYNKKIRKKNTTFLIAFNNEHKSIGAVRYETEKNLTYVSIYISKKLRNHGYGSKILKMSEKFLKKKIIIISRIKKNNIKSIKIFKNNNYKLINNDGYTTLIKVN
jgi:spore coat polysaccharide biosynthesis protein SpsF